MPRAVTRAIPAAFCCLVAASCGGDAGSSPPPTPGDGLRLETVATGLVGPLYLTAPPGDRRLFVVEQRGQVRIIENGAVRPTPFLDLAGQISSGGERGLLSIAFDPAHAQNGYLYVNYTDPAGDTRIERYRTFVGDSNRVDPTSASPVLSIEQPFANHNGGLLLFGPDGMLYIGMGDGGGAGDPRDLAQNPSELLGKLLRIDVRRTPYAIPPDNPFVDTPGTRPEIWALGLRNPWRFSFDTATQRLFVADVGQNREEEVTVVPAAAAGVNYGWRIMEGSRCFTASTCTQTGLALPQITYGRSDGCSITGGYVYRGSATVARGQYFYSDFCSGWLRSVTVAADGSLGATREWEVGPLGAVRSFGEDDAGELYVLTGNGTVYRIASERLAR